MIKLLMLRHRAFCRAFSTSVRTKPFQVAIDGPAASGKSTTAKLVAQRLGFDYIDTGAFYRCITFATLSKGIDPSDSNNNHQISDIAERSVIQLQTVFAEPPPAFNNGQPSSSLSTRSFLLPTTRVFLNSKDVSSDIRTGIVSKHVSAVAAIGNVREAVLQKVRNLGATDAHVKGPNDSKNDNNNSNSGLAAKLSTPKGLVMDGRDIGTVVLPHADLKVFLVADSRVRAERRLQELIMNAADSTELQGQLDVEAVQKDLERRDELDRTRKVSPLRKAEDAMELDTSNLTIEEQVDAIVQEALHRQRQC
ncbi:hypothetical protein BX616_010382 [Lobosporangium transversale]|uniref:(d)CMP kinase n=1 Tax=Lobosporangium transversale TaxID=64571 RepID=A0A1Y2H2H9_9FUNG|nr:Cytidylate kinase-domain-containing protein [Lobosporangium transversale]KAF9912222.1 hypothetical protein BX616_010382 [Lobosporangium transversale]ORZ28191.1 Cytidylate kinase-domain-containing protein [Lobosporangium transversale]|eukprot:XP_021885876.1 Cytidylate kinase-domain-containing protein [Lobosporangium transversale]